MRPEFVRVDDGSSLCLTFEPGVRVPQLLISPPVPDADPLTTTPRWTEDGAVLADRVLVPPGRAALVEAVPAEDTPTAFAACADPYTTPTLADGDWVFEHLA